MSIAWNKLKFLLTLLFLGSSFVSGCVTRDTNPVPSDFLFIMDVKSGGNFEGCPVNINIHIDAKGRGKYETYDSDCAIEYNTNYMVTYCRNQVIQKGQFKLSNAELEGFWDAIIENNFFNLIEDYRMAMGFSYAFIVVKAD